jgi:predicted RND superfamily exporter protein
MVIPLRKATINSDLNTYLPSDIPEKINQDKLEALFGSSEPVILFFHSNDILNPKTLDRIQKLSKAFGRMKDFERVISLFDIQDIHSEEGSMVVDPAVKRIPSSDIGREKLRERIRSNDLAYKTIVSEDFTYTLIVLFPGKNVTDKAMIGSINEQLKTFPGDEKVYLNGTPYLRYEIQRKAIRDIVILLPIGLLIMIFFLYFSFHELRGVILPLSVVLMSILLSMGLIPLLGWDFSLIAVLVPILMIAIANNYGVHIISRYQESNALNRDWTMQQIVTDNLNQLTRPIVLTALTTIVGILGMVAQVMLPPKQMGVVSAIGILFALLLSLSFIPAVLAGMKKGNVQKSYTGNSSSVVDRMLKWMGTVAPRSPYPLLVIFVIFLVVSGSGIARLKVSINNEKILPRLHPLRISNNIADKNFGGTNTLTLLFEGDIKSPEVLRTMDQFEQELIKIPEVGNVTSIAKVIKIISRALNNPDDPYYDTIPDTREAIAQYVELYSMSGDPDDFEQLVNFDYTRASLNVQFVANDMKTFNRIIAKVDSLKAESPYCTIKGGYSLVEKVISESVVRGQIFSLLFAILAIGILLFLIFRSLSAGLIGCIPLFYSLICNFGLMGWVGLELDIATSLISSIAIGIGVDYTIHIFWRLKKEIEKGKTLDAAIKLALKTTGRGITINAVSVMLGFAVLFISALTILKTFAFLIIFSILLCLLCSLMLIPALCKILKPAFLFKLKNQ